MKTIYVTEFEACDGDCMYSVSIRAFLSKLSADNFAIECREEFERVKKELEEHDKKYEAENEELVKKLREMIMAKTPSKDYQNSPEMKRRYEIGKIGRAILDSHKHQPNFHAYYSDSCDYHIEELELDDESEIQSRKEKNAHQRNTTR